MEGYKILNSIDADFEIADEFNELDISSAKNQLSILNNMKSANDFDVNNTEIEKELRKSFTELVDKHKIGDIEYKDFKDIIKGLADYTKKESEFNKLFTSKLVGAMTDAATTKCIMSLGFLIDKSLSKIIKMTEEATDDYQDLNLLISSMREIFSWLKQLETLKKSYYLAGADKGLESLGNIESGDGKDRLSPASISELIRKINSEVEDET
jgi:hypothetical protein